jgi:hypothetical protein
MVYQVPWKPEALLPRNIEYVRSSCDDWKNARLVVAGVTVSLTVGLSFIDLVIEGDLALETCRSLVDESRRNAEVAARSSCVFD